MRLITSSLVAAGAVAGIVGAVVSYQSVIDTGPVVERPVSAPTVAESTPAVTTKLLPCEKGTKLVKGTCVRTKHRVIVREVPAPVEVAPPAQVAGPASLLPATVPNNQAVPHDEEGTEGGRDDDDGEGYGEDREEDYGHYEDDDHEDDHGDDGHEDDD